MVKSGRSSMVARASVPATTSPVAYEDRLNQESEWALEQGSRHFEERSAVHETLRRIVKRLDELGIPYAIVGGMALFRHGYRRFTEDVDILVTKQGLEEIHNRLEGRGYLPPFAGSKHLRDTELGVRIEFLVAGQFPGDGKPKAVAFPDPAEASIEIDGVHCIRLERLIEMKLASGMTSTARARDLVDVQELISTLNLKRDLATSLNDYVCPEYERIWDAVYGEKKRFMTMWAAKELTAEVASMDDLIRLLPNAANELESMKADGVQLDSMHGAGDGYVYLVTTDPEIAAKYDMHPESEFMDEPDEEEE